MNLQEKEVRSGAVRYTAERGLVPGASSQVPYIHPYLSIPECHCALNDVFVLGRILYNWLECLVCIAIAAWCLKLRINTSLVHLACETALSMGVAQVAQKCNLEAL